jgi:hypothetical protein
MKVSDLQGGMLDYWTALADESWKWAHDLLPTMTLDPTFSGAEYEPEWQDGYGEIVGACILIPSNPFHQDRLLFRPSTNWDHGGPIIERQRIWLSDDEGEWLASCHPDHTLIQEGKTPLIAAMRACVASKYGDEIPNCSEWNSKGRAQ